jgi:hypothetical protein
MAGSAPASQVDGPRRFGGLAGQSLRVNQNKADSLASARSGDHGITTSPHSTVKSS